MDELERVEEGVTGPRVRSDRAKVGSDASRLIAGFCCVLLAFSFWGMGVFLWDGEPEAGGGGFTFGFGGAGLKMRVHLWTCRWRGGG